MQDNKYYSRLKKNPINDLKFEYLREQLGNYEKGDLINKII